MVRKHRSKKDKRIKELVRKTDIHRGRVGKQRPDEPFVFIVLELLLNSRFSLSNYMIFKRRNDNITGKRSIERSSFRVPCIKIASQL